MEVLHYQHRHIIDFLLHNSMRRKPAADDPALACSLPFFKTRPVHSFSPAPTLLVVDFDSRNLVAGL